MIALTIVNQGRKWWVGWPYKLVDREYVLPTPEHELLEVWWRESHVSDPLQRTYTIVALLADVDLAVRRKAPPVAFQLVRLGVVKRTYNQTSCVCNDSHFEGVAKTETTLTGEQHEL
jgi:hypothetical protein